MQACVAGVATYNYTQACSACGTAYGYCMSPACWHQRGAMHHVPEQCTRRRAHLLTRPSLCVAFNASNLEQLQKLLVGAPVPAAHHMAALPMLTPPTPPQQGLRAPQADRFAGSHDWWARQQGAPSQCKPAACHATKHAGHWRTHWSSVDSVDAPCAFRLLMSKPASSRARSSSMAGRIRSAQQQQDALSARW